MWIGPCLFVGRWHGRFRSASKRDLAADSGEARRNWQRPSHLPVYLVRQRLQRHSFRTVQMATCGETTGAQGRGGGECVSCPAATTTAAQRRWIDTCMLCGPPPFTGRPFVCLFTFVNSTQTLRSAAAHHSGSPTMASPARSAMAGRWFAVRPKSWLIAVTRGPSYCQLLAEPFFARIHHAARRR